MYQRHNLIFLGLQLVGYNPPLWLLDWTQLANLFPLLQDYSVVKRNNDLVESLITLVSWLFQKFQSKRHKVFYSTYKIDSHLTHLDIFVFLYKLPIIQSASTNRLELRYFRMYCQTMQPLLNTQTWIDQLRCFSQLKVFLQVSIQYSLVTSYC